MSNSSLVTVVVGLAESHRERLDEAVAALEAAGLTVQRRLKTLGQITGSIPRERLAALKRVTGVAYVEASGEYRAL
ncbi:MAG: hypothetical protein NZ585_06455 [Chloracidobacterium sp.]|nr:hypothetical protein [Chloracidobacterium sp.]MDW8218328.1 hypothetical protein [Acidobacteriota bacterium]